MSRDLASDDRAVRVLVAGGDRDTVETLATLFSGSGYQTAVGFDVATALAKLAQLMPHVVVIDLNISDKAGDGVSRLLPMPLASKARPYRIALGASSGEEVPAAFAGIGFDFYLSKPVDIRTLISVLEDFVKRGIHGN